jgi:glycogen(starch) synthase
VRVPADRRGGLARHVSKLSEALVRAGVEIHILTRGRASLAAERDGRRAWSCIACAKTRCRATRRLRRMGRGDELAHARRRRQLGKRLRFDLVHGHDWLVAGAAASLAQRLRIPYLTTIHATEYGRHQGSVDKHP